MDYIVVHELCHLIELNHGKAFWTRVAEQIPDYRERIKELKQIEQRGTSIKALAQVKMTTEIQAPVSSVSIGEIYAST